MAKNLGIKINVDFPSVSELQTKLESKLGKEGLKVKIDFDASDSISALKTQLSSAFGKGVKIKLGISDRELLRDLDKIEKKIQSSQTNIASSLGKSTVKGFQDGNGSMNTLTANSRTLTKAVFEANRGIGKIQMSVNTATSSMSKLKQMQASMGEVLPEGVYRASDAMNKAFKQQVANSQEMSIGVYRLSDKVQEIAGHQEKVNKSIKDGSNAYREMAQASNELSNSEKRSMVSATNKTDRLKEIASIMKEINGLELKRTGADEKTQAAIDKRIASLKSMESIIKENLLKNTGVNSDDSALIKETKALGDYKRELKEIADEKAKQNALTAKDDAAVRELMNLENERFNLRRQAGKAGTNEADELNKQASAIDKQITKFKESNKLIHASEESMRKLNAMYAENSRMESRDKAKVIDKESSALLSTFKNDLKQIYALKDKISKLSIEKEHGVARSNVDVELNGLKQELKLRRDIHDTQVKNAQTEGKLSRGDSKNLDNMRKEMSYQQRLAAETHKTNAKKAQYAREESSQMAESKSALKEYASQLSKINGLYEKRANAGRFEAQEIDGIIRAEERRYEIMKKQANLQGKLKPEHAQELANIEKESQVTRHNNKKIQRGSQLDKDMNQFSLQEMFSPRRIYGDARQAFNEVLESVERIDTALVQVEKVADEPQDKIKAFSDNVFNYATKFGVSADGYANAVEKWITTGKSLDESVALANASVMGSFVGNIGEEDMVKYMAVPLNAYKKEALEANDVINAMNEVSNNNAIEMDDLGAAYERAASTAASAGTSFSELTGMITAAQEATRAGGEKIGTALKFIDLSFGSMAARNTKGNQEKFDFFKNMNVDIVDSNNQLRSTYDILNDLDKVWGKLNSTDKSTASNYIAGKNHAAVFTGMMANWGTANKAKNESQGQIDLVDKESGSAFQEFEKQQQSVAYALQGVKNAWDELLNTVSGGKGAISSVLDTVAGGLRKINELAKDPKMRDLGLGLLKAGGIMTATSAASKLFTVMSAGTRAVTGGILKMGFGLAKMAPLLTKTGREAAKAKKASQVVELATDVAGATGEIVKKSSKLGKVGGAIGGIAKGLGGFIPVIGGVISVMSIMEEMGIPTWSALGKVIEKVTGKTKEVSKATQEYVETQKEAQKEVKENTVLNGKLAEAQAFTREYHEVVTKKEEKRKEQQQNGQDVDGTDFTPEEFEVIKKGIEKRGEDLGLKINVEVNDMEQLNKYVAKLEEAEKLKQKVEGKKVIDGLGEDTANDTADKIKKEEKEKRKSKEEGKKQLEAHKKRSANGQRSGAGDMGWGSDSDFEGSDETITKYDPSKYKDFIEQRKKDLKSFADTRSAIVREMNNGNLKESYKDADYEGQKRTVGVLASELPVLEKKKRLTEDANEALKKGNKLTTEQMNLLKKADPENFEKRGTKTSEWDEDTKGKAASILGKQAEEANGKFTQLKDTLIGLKENTDLKIDIDKVMEKAMLGGKGFVDEMLKLGDVGANILGVSGAFMTSTDDWKASLQQVQEQLEGIPEEKKVKFGLVQDNGALNFDIADQILALPEEVKTTWRLTKDDGTLDLNSLTFMLDQLNDKKINPELKLDTNGDDIVDAKELLAALNSEDGKKILMGLEIKAEGADKANKEIEKLKQSGGMPEALKVRVEAETEEAHQKIQSLYHEDGTLKTAVELSTEAANSAYRDMKNGFEPIPLHTDVAPAQEEVGSLWVYATNTMGQPVMIDANTLTAEEKIALVSKDRTSNINVTTNAGEATPPLNEVKNTSSEIDTLKPNVTVTGNNDDAINKGKLVLSQGQEIDTSKPTVVITSNANAIIADLNSLIALTATPMNASVNITKTITEQTVKGMSPTKSVKIGGISYSTNSANLGKSLSVGIASGIAKSNSIGISKSTKSGSDSKKKDTKVDEDVWRYWAKELFKGIPLERTMSDLNNSIKMAGENQDKLISLYKEQNALLVRQEAYNKEMRKAKQDELNSVLAKLRADGFKTKGNEITNFERAKAFSEDKASEVNENLRKYKDLFKSLDELTGKINAISSSKYENDEKIKKAKIDKEAKALDDRLKKSEANTKMISNRTNIQDKKLSMVSDGDYELKSAITEESANLAKQSIKDLAEQFNELSKINIENAENADKVQSKLEDIKSEILRNADAIAQYKSALEDLRIERLTNDFDKFNNTIKRNIGFLDSNIEHLKEGLANRTKFSDLTSSYMSPFSIARKSSMEREAEKRLRLEDDLNKALDAFAQKNVDRAKNVSDAVLKIEESKYSALLKMQKDYTNGYVSTYKITNPTIAVGRVAVGVDDKEHINWINKLGEANARYAADYKKHADEYQNVMKSSADAKDKEIAKNKFILDQLRTQEDMYGSIVKYSQEAANKILDELNNPSLTTEQRGKIEEQFNQLKDESISAQQAISETIKKRYEFYFELMEKSSKNLKSETEKFERILAIANAAGMKPESTTSLHKTILAGKAKEYNDARLQLASLYKEQKRVAEGTLEWNLLGEKIQTVTENIHELTIGLLESNKNILDNQIDIIDKKIQKGLLGGKNLEEYKDFKDKWFTGVARELELEKLRLKAIDLEDDVMTRKLEAIERQEKLSKSDVEYLDKQMKIVELQKKLSNLDKQRNVQTISRNDDGTWAWEYVKDMTEYDKTKDELLDARRDLESYKDSQRESFADKLSDIVKSAKDSKYENVEDLKVDIKNLKEAFKTVLDDMPDMKFGNIDEFIEAYDTYLRNNHNIVRDLAGFGSKEQLNNQMELLGSTIETSFKNAANDIIKVISAELKNVMRLANTSQREGQSGSVVIQSQELSFPNVTDSDGLEEAFLSLPDVVTQKINRKW